MVVSASDGLLVRDLRDAIAASCWRTSCCSCGMRLTVGICRRTGEFNRFNRVAETGSSSSEKTGGLVMSLSARWGCFDRKSSRRLESTWTGRFWAGRGSLVGGGPCAFVSLICRSLPLLPCRPATWQPAAGQLPSRHLSVLNLIRVRNRIHLCLRPISRSPVRSGTSFGLAESNPVIRAQRKAGTGKGHPPIDPHQPKSHKYPRRRPRHRPASPLQPTPFVYSPCSPFPALPGSPAVDSAPLPPPALSALFGVFPRGVSPLIPRRTSDKGGRETAKSLLAVTLQRR